MAGEFLSNRRKRALLLVATAIFVVYILYLARGALTPFLVAGFMAYLLLPVIVLIERKFPRWVAIAIVYVVLIGGFSTLMYVVGPVVGSQLGRLIERGPEYFQEVRAWQEWYRQLDLPLRMRWALEENVQKLAENVSRQVGEETFFTLSFASSTLTAIVTFLVVPVWLFYLLHDRDRIAGTFRWLLPGTYWDDLRNMVRIIDAGFGAFIRAQAILAAFVAVMVTVGLTILGVDYALVLGIVAGVLEFIPFVGPIAGAIPALFIAFFGSPVLFLQVIVLFVVVQWVENAILVPKIQGDVVRLHPVFIVIALFIGGEIGGILGMFVAVPVVVVARDLFRYFHARFSEEEPQAALFGSSPLVKKTGLAESQPAPASAAEEPLRPGLAEEMEPGAESQ